MCKVYWHSMIIVQKMVALYSLLAFRNASGSGKSHLDQCQSTCTPLMIVLDVLYGEAKAQEATYFQRMISYINTSNGLPCVLGACSFGTNVLFMDLHTTIVGIFASLNSSKLFAEFL